MKHIPVLLDEVLSYLQLQPGMTVVDATLGGGGYAREIVRRISPRGIFIGIDRDYEAILRVKSELEELGETLDVSVYLVHRNYSEIQDVLRELGKKRVGGIVADLGFSSLQMDDGQRGLSFMKDGPLDMRFDRESDTETAEEIVNNRDVKELELIFREYGEEKYARNIARAIEEYRKGSLIATTKDLREIIENVVKRKKEKIHPATRVFQALRMEVNQEMHHLEKFLEASLDVLDICGRLSVVSFHSGEDKRVKMFFRENARGCICPKTFPMCRCGRLPRIKIITKKVIKPKEEEVRINVRSRSAKLRVAERL
jgi:16S rRNA (cytosine1402-N4)-methyltransferase